MVAYILVPAFVALAVIGDCVATARSRSAITKWTSTSGYTLCRLSRKWVAGPWLGGRNSRVFAITIRDQLGEQKEGFARVKGLLGSDSPSDVELRWKEGGSAPGRVPKGLTFDSETGKFS